MAIPNLVHAFGGRPPGARSILRSLWFTRILATLKPVGNALAVSFCVAVVTFFLIRFLLGDPAYQFAMAQGGGQPPAPDQVAAIRHDFGLDRPLLVQFGSFLLGLSHGDLGTSYQTRGMPVSHLVFGNLGTTFALTALTIVVSAISGIALGLLVAIARSRLLDNLVRTTAMVGIAAPSALVGLVLMLVVADTGGLLPSGGWGTGYPGNFRYLVLPVLTLAVWFVPAILRVALERARAVLDEPHIEAALTRGIPPGRLVIRHVLPNCALPILNFVALNTAWLLSGAVVVEMVFGTPGIGHTMANAISADDYPVIQACTLLTGLVVVLCSMTAAMIGRAIDPRTR
jgi:peptide/nickel transport system permease protein